MTGSELLILYQRFFEKMNLKNQKIEKAFLRSMKRILFLKAGESFKEAKTYEELYSLLDEKERNIFLTHFVCTTRPFSFASDIYKSIQNQFLLNEKKFDYPTVFHILKGDDGYFFQTFLGEFSIKKANEVIDSSIFEKPLKNQCFLRSYEYLKEKQNANIILTKMKLLFFGYFYHALIEEKDFLLDLASNSLFEDKAQARKIFYQEETICMTYDEVEELWEGLCKEFFHIENYFNPLCGILTTQDLLKKKLKR